ncbi:MAG: glycosyltransferase family 4 protein [Bacteroidales bacterium]|nr:glycosyltransferase family 4 protein [Bacteroidales bacterium]
MNNPKVIIFYNKLFHYRIPVWNLLAEKCDLTVTYSSGDGKVPDGIECRFKVMYIPAKKFFNRIVWQKMNVRSLAKQYDVVISYADISWVRYNTLPWFNKTKVVFHTLGVTASYNRPFDSNNNLDRIRKFLFSKADALAFYTTYPIEKYAKMGIPREKMFEAPNTVEVRPVKESYEKDSILFIGTLYKQKGLQTLLDAYLALKNVKGLPKLRIIGKGPDSDAIKTWIEDNNMSKFVEMTGAIYNIDEKAKFFARAYACVSPQQAGLSVPESMGYGVPFVTSQNAITGGEIFNIHNGKDGVVMGDLSQLTSVIRDIAEHKEKYVEMGKLAQKFYNENRTPQHMADGLWRAVQYAMTH